MSLASDMSGLDSNPVINQLKRQINCLKTDLIRFKLIAKSYKNYFDYFNELNKFFVSNEELLGLRNRIKVLKYGQKSCFISVEKLKENQLNQLNPQMKTYLSKTDNKTRNASTQTIKTDPNHQFNGLFIKQEVVLKKPNEAQETIDLKTDNGIPYEVLYGDENGIPYEGLNGIQNEVQNEDQNEIQSDNNLDHSLRANKRPRISISEDSDDNYLEYKDNSDIDIDFEPDDEPIPDSGEEWEEPNQVKKRPTKANGTQNAFPCDVEGCVYSGSCGKYLRRHKRRVHSDGDLNQGSKATFFCDVLGCQRKFRTQIGLNSHMIVHRPREETTEARNAKGFYDCTYIGCGKEFRTLSYLRTHMEVHTDFVFKCEVEGCTSVFNRRSYLRKHMFKHLGKYRCPIEGCPFAARDAGDLKKHEGTHSDATPFVCAIDKCVKRFKNHYLLRRHQLRAHPDLKEFDDMPWFDCKEENCGFKTKSKCAMDLHERQHTRPWPCPQCEKSYPTNAQLTIHLAVHLDELKTPCDWPGCEKLFTTKAQMKDHVNVHTRAITYSCYWPSCERTFFMRAALDSHINQHKGSYNKTKTLYTCEQCSFSTTKKVELRNHVIEHGTPMTLPQTSKSNNYSCEQCSFSSCKKVDLRNHVCEHGYQLNGELKYQVNELDDEFIQPRLQYDVLDIKTLLE